MSFSESRRFERDGVDRVIARIALAAVLEVIAPAVPSAYQVAVFFDPSLAQVAALMRANTINRVAASTGFDNNSFPLRFRRSMRAQK